LKGHSKKTAKPDYQKSNFADECYFSIAETAAYIYCYVNNNLSYFFVRSETIKASTPQYRLSAMPTAGKPVGRSVISHLT
jgi:hypothetical protein